MLSMAEVIMRVPLLSSQWSEMSAEVGHSHVLYVCVFAVFHDSYEMLILVCFLVALADFCKICLHCAVNRRKYSSVYRKKMRNKGDAHVLSGKVR